MTDESLIRDKYRRITKALIERKMTVTAMESCTSGLIASLITDTEGASAIFRGSYVTYSNEQKIRLGVDAEIIDRYSVYSKETALAMAKACRTAFEADLSIGITGTTGNIDPENAQASIPGRVYFAVNDTAFEMDIPPQESRYKYKLAAADMVADEILRFIKSAEL